MKADLRLRLRCLQAKGQMDLNFDGLAAKPAFEAQYRLANELGNRQVAARATGELAIIAFLSGNTAEAKKRIFSAIASSILNKDIGAQMRYCTIEQGHVRLGLRYTRGCARGQAG